MRSVNIAELKNRLSTYLGYAKSGEEVVIRDRNLPVAKLVPFIAENATEEELVLVAQGKLRLAKRRFNPEKLFQKRAPITTGNSIFQEVVNAVISEREEGY